MNKLSVVLCILALLFLTACDSIKTWFVLEFKQDNVSDGVSRLSVQHLAVILNEINKKFNEPQAKVDILQDTDNKQKGSATWTLENIDINYPTEQIVYKDCQGKEATFRGQALVLSAVRTMRGQLTHNPDKPIIPDPDSIRIAVRVKAHDLEIRFTGSEGHLRIDDGEIDFEAKPRLATTQKGALSGMRTTPTSNTRFENIKLKNFDATLFAADLSIPVVVSKGELFMQVGVGEDGQENVLRGAINLFGNHHVVPSDGLGLNPRYHAEDFMASYSCHEDLSGVVRYEHMSFEEKMAVPSAALTTALMATILSRLEEDESCGMSSPQVLRQVHLSAASGRAGKAEFALTKPCVLTFNDFITKPDCFGRARKVSGAATVIQAKKALSGLLMTDNISFSKAVFHYEREIAQGSKNKRRPIAIVPTSRQPATVDFSAEFSELVMEDICLDSGNRAHAQHCKNQRTLAPSRVKTSSGSAHAIFNPVVLKQLDENSSTALLCSAPSPIVQAQISLHKVKSEIERAHNRFKVMTDGEIELIRGPINGRENEVSGTLELNSALVALPKGTVLDASYEQTQFFDSFLSCEQTALVKSDEECRPDAGIALNIARLLVQNAGSLVKLSTRSTIAGSFTSKEALMDRHLENDERLVLQADISSPVVLDDELFISRDDLGNETHLYGAVSHLKGEMTRVGKRLNQPKVVAGINLNPLSYTSVEALSAYLFDRKEIFIRPLKPDATSIALQAHVVDFTARTKKAGSIGYDPHLVMHEAQMKISAKPIMGMDKRTKDDEQPSYSIATPVMKFAKITLNDAAVTLTGGGFSLPVFIKEAEISAFNGRYKGEGNYVSFALTWSLSNDDKNSWNMSEDNKNLVPGFEQNKFNKSYINTPFLYENLAHD